MYARKIIGLVAGLGLLSLSAKGQDFFEDVRANGTPILRGDAKKALLTPRISTPDKSVKVNFFKLTTVGDKSDVSKKDSNGVTEPQSVTLPANEENPPPRTTPIRSNGWGFSVKATLNDKIGSIIGSGNFSKGASVGAYKAWIRLERTNGSRLFGNILSLNATTDSYRFFQSDKPVKEQLGSFSAYTGLALSFSHFADFAVGDSKKSEIILGYSISLARKDNYDDLDKVDIKNITQYKTGTDSLRTSTVLDTDGDTYAVTNAKTAFNQFFTAQLRGSITYIPTSLENKVAFVFYPEIVHQFDGLTKVNANIALHFLKEGEPSTSLLGLFLTFKDLTNAAEKDKPFFNRSLVFGVTTGWNVLLGK